MSKRRVFGQTAGVTRPVVNLVDPADLTEEDVVEALARIAAQDAGLAHSADHAYEVLTWGEGPGVLRQAGLQFWLWYTVPTKYITDEAGYMSRLAQGAAALFDELGLHAYSAICRSSITAEVHAAYDRSGTEGQRVASRAIEKSGVSPSDLADFSWSDFMGGEESSAHSAVEDALERAIAARDLVVGGRGWRVAQAAVVESALDGDHPDLPGQSWRTAVLTERLECWIGAAERQSNRLGSARAAVANRILHPAQPPSGLLAAVAPLIWLLDRHGDEQPLTQAGYLTPSFVRSLQDERPGALKAPLSREISKEGDDVALLVLREWLQLAGALRKRKSKLVRTSAGAAMATDPAQAWNALTRHLAPRGWEGFVAEAALLHLLDAANRDVEPSYDSVLAFVAAVAEDMGWTTTEEGERRVPSEIDVAWALFDSRRLWETCDLITAQRTWQDQRFALTEAGEAAALGYLRHTAAGPRTSLE